MPPPPVNQDPVIQGLANRAATDNSLKELMKVVASGGASPEQLRVFQCYIDDVTASARATWPAPAPAESADSPLATGASGGRPPLTASGTPTPNQPTPAMPRPELGSAPSRSAPENPPSYSRRGPAGTEAASRTPYSARPQPGPDPISPIANAPLKTTAVVFAFSAGSGDRYLFPKHSILEFMSQGTHVVASFLVLRPAGDRSEPSPPSSSSSSSRARYYDPALDYYQPVTVQLSASSAKVLDPLAKVVASPAQARAYMTEVMANTARAEESCLVLRLPRSPTAAGLQRSTSKGEAAVVKQELEERRPTVNPSVDESAPSAKRRKSGRSRATG
ncbi:MAG: hypothetical protein M1826_000002 [Phylliscum demangeonii]|nr:MAG: hypothetical protein M1826_000002 [Phylliscum demangeonii]